MDLIVTTEQRFECTPDGWSWIEVAHAYSFWSRYLAVFDQVLVVARARKVSEAPPGWMRADGERVSFAIVPYYIGTGQYLSRVRRVASVVRQAVASGGAVILRVPSPIAGHAIPILRRANRPYGIEVVGDPYDVFAPGANTHPLRPFYRWWFARQLKHCCAKACAVAYVTKEALQRRYPPSQGSFSTHYSSIELSDEALASAPRVALPRDRSLTIITVGTLEQLYKAPDLLIDSFNICVQQGLDIRLSIVGDGKHRPELEKRAAALGLTERVRFLGQLPAGEAVREQLDRADLFVLPSRQEGLPRAMVEAMARGLPCIGSTVGGIPELLPPEDMVPPNDAAALAQKLKEVLTDPERMARSSARNLEKAKEYHDDILNERRVAFYQYVKRSTEEWLAKCDN